MWLSERRAFLGGLAAAACLAGCGFRPALGPGGPAAALEGAVSFDPPANRDDYALSARLEARLGRAHSPRYHLSAAPSVRRSGLAITQDEETTRYNLIGTARFTLTELATGAVVAAGEVNTFTAYSARGTTLAASTAERDARARLMVLLADRIVARLQLGLLLPGQTAPDAPGTEPGALDRLDERLEEAAGDTGVL